jgi:hypothetical protein
MFAAGPLVGLLCSVGDDVEESIKRRRTGKRGRREEGKQELLRLMKK